MLDIKRFFAGVNFMTPNILEYGELAKENDNKMYYELSTGTGFSSGYGNSNRLYGVTIVEVDNNGNIQSRFDLSRCYSNLLEARADINKMRVVS
jgi:hypothetical protein